MGTDWQPRLERRTPTGWESLWEPTLPSYWYERILDADTEVGKLLTFSDDEDVAYKAYEAHLQGMTKEEVVSRFGDDARVTWKWREATYSESSIFKQRDYSWFGAISYIRGYNQLIQSAPFPADASKLVRFAYERDSGDVHSAGCLMVSDILSCAGLQGFSQVAWLRQNVPDPDNTRLIFWFG